MVRFVCALSLVGGVAVDAQAQEEALSEEVAAPAQPQEQTPVAGPEGGAPVSFPDTKHYAALWERSVFTTKDLPSPDAPTGPIFTDNLGLSGMYEMDGQIVAVLIDRTTSQFTEARIGSENEQGIKIRKVAPGATMDKTRVQLQKGDIAGWVTFGDVTAAAAPSEQAPPAAGNPQQVQPAQPVSPPPPAASPLLPAIHAVPTPATPRAAAPPPPAAMFNDVPLPPP